ncbi:MBL fold metallo-hydrolase [Clostridiaceae bacterium M8S5]|nr:MBL fold metallo-hydrolase [Clostridiaceae bacterium M8S5]
MKKYKFEKIAILLVIITMIVCGCQGTQNSDPKALITNRDLKEAGVEVHFIDVGQADCILIKMGSKVSLIDGGNRDDSELVVAYLKKQNIKAIDYLVATHPHEDHIGGLPEVIRRFDIHKIYMPNKVATTKIFKTMLKEIKSKNIEVVSAKGGDMIYCNDNITYSVVAPNSDEYDETNEYSVVTKLKYKEKAFIFTGDAEKDSEDEMVNMKYALKADVLKVGHHGGRTSSNTNFLNKVQPQIAVISCGKGNDYGHPNDEVLQRLRNVGTKIYRTDSSGTIIIKTDGNNIYVNNNVHQEVEVEKESNKVKKIIGNINSKIYHKIEANHLPKKNNQTIFDSSIDAEKEGYKPCSKCY